MAPTRLTRGGPATERLCRLGLVGAVLIYTSGYLLWYSGTPLGLYPVLDGREMIVTARQIADTDLPREPFYRAPVYPAVLALALELGAPVTELPIVARLLNGLCHVASTFLVWSLAGIVWGRALSAFLAAALFGLNPVVLHFVGDPLDITLAILLMLAGIRLAVASQAALSTVRRAVLVAAAGSLFALGGLTRPQLLSLVALWPVIQVMAPGRGRQRLVQTLSAVLPAALILGGFGMVNHAISGDFRILPWQGAYNLWAANKPGAHGRYFEQIEVIHSYEETGNAARLESQRLYLRDNPGARALDPDRVTAYWRARAIDRVTSTPLSWGKQMAGKLYYLINNFEQYNNKTYAMHKTRSPWLAPNPIGWSLVLVPGVLGIGLAWRSQAMRLIAWCAGAYAAGVLLFYVSARFRLPLVPLLAVGAGVIGDIGARIRAHTGRRAVLALGAAAVIGGLSLIPIPGPQRRETYVQDYLLLSKAAAEIGAHAEALAFAEQAAAFAPHKPMVVDLLCVTGFNARVLDGASEPPSAVLATLERHCRRAAPFSDSAARLLGIIDWRTGRRADAVARWRALLDRGSAERENLLAALVVVGRLRPADAAEIRSIGYRRMSDHLVLALALSGDGAASREVAARFTAEQREAQFRSLRALFPVDRPGS